MASLFFGRRDKLSHVTERLFHTEMGCTIVCALFGVALAFMFQKVCKGAHCSISKSPPVEDINKYIYEIDGEGCYKYTPKVVDCKI